MKKFVLAYCLDNEKNYPRIEFISGNNAFEALKEACCDLCFLPYGISDESFSDWLGSQNRTVNLVVEEIK